MFVHYFTLLLCLTFLYCMSIFVGECFYNRGLCLNYVPWTRCLTSVLVSSAVTYWGLKRKSIDWTGAVSGFFFGLILTFANYCFFACLLTFFYTSSKATHFYSEKKRKFEGDFREGGQRNWIQVVSNGGVAVEVALLYLLVPNSLHGALIFSCSDYFASCLATAIVAALAGVNGDTWASELGTVLSRKEPRLITTFKRVPVGTNGGFTPYGLLFSALGGFVVGVSYFVALLITGEAGTATFHQAVLLSFIGTFSGVFGSVIDSVLGATLQYSGLHVHSGKVVETPGFGVQHISGRPILSNHSVNLIMSIINSILVPILTVSIVKK